MKRVYSEEKEDIYCPFNMIRTSIKNEFAISTIEALLFVKVDKRNLKFNVRDFHERYFLNHEVKESIELKKDIYAVAIENSPKIRFINRKYKA